MISWSLPPLLTHFPERKQAESSRTVNDSSAVAGIGGRPMDGIAHVTPGLGALLCLLEADEEHQRDQGFLLKLQSQQMAELGTEPVSVQFQSTWV